MIDSQTVANDIRDRLADNPAVRRVGIELLWAAAPDQVLTVRAKHRNRVLTLERPAGWLSRPAANLAQELAHELVAEALANDRPAVAPPRWRTMARSEVQPLPGMEPDPMLDPTPPR